MAEFQRNEGYEALGSLFSMPGWKVVEDSVRNEIFKYTEQLSALKRPEGTSDDFLRGRIAMAKEILVQFRAQYREYEARKTLAANPPKEAEAFGSLYAEAEANPQ